MPDEPKDPVNFRLARSYKDALARLAEAQDRPMSELVREAVETYVDAEERRAWEEEARRAARVLAREAEDPASAESEMLGVLEAALDEFADTWVWDEDAGGCEGPGT